MLHISSEYKQILLQEFKFVTERMSKARDPMEMMYFFSGLYSMTNRIINIEYDSDLAFIDMVLTVVYRHIKPTVDAMFAGDKTILLPDDYFERLIQYVHELAREIERTGSYYQPLRKIANLAYMSTGNGYYLMQKGIDLVGDSKRKSQKTLP